MLPRVTIEPRSGRHRAEDGQILVLFTLSIVVLIGVVGLVLDGGSAFAQRRQEQNVADLAALAGATAYLNTSGGTAAKEAAATDAAQLVATSNGYPDDAPAGVDVSVTVSSFPSWGNVQVGVTKPHVNRFVAVLGFPTWDVSVEATAQASSAPNGALGAMPLLFNAEAFPGALCDESAGGCIPEVYQLPGTGNDDVPQDATQFNWTVFCTANGGGNEDDGDGHEGCNANTSTVRSLLDGNGTDTVVDLDDDIGAWDAGTHAGLFDDLANHVGETFPVPIVNDEGEMQGFAYFKLLSVEGSPDKVIRGYFVSPVNASQLVVVNNGPTPTINTGLYIIRLID